MSKCTVWFVAIFGFMTSGSVFCKTVGSRNDTENAAIQKKVTKKVTRKPNDTQISSPWPLLPTIELTESREELETELKKCMNLTLLISHMSYMQSASRTSSGITIMRSLLRLYRLYFLLSIALGAGYAGYLLSGPINEWATVQGWPYETLRKVLAVLLPLGGGTGLAAFLASLRFPQIISRMEREALTDLLASWPEYRAQVPHVVVPLIEKVYQRFSFDGQLPISSQKISGFLAMLQMVNVQQMSVIGKKLALYKQKEAAKRKIEQKEGKKGEAEQAKPAAIPSVSTTDLFDMGDRL